MLRSLLKKKKKGRFIYGNSMKSSSFLGQRIVKFSTTVLEWKQTETRSLIRRENLLGKIFFTQPIPLKILPNISTYRLRKSTKSLNVAAQNFCRRVESGPTRTWMTKF